MEASREIILKRSWGWYWRENRFVRLGLVLSSWGFCGLLVGDLAGVWKYSLYWMLLSGTPVVTLVISLIKGNDPSRNKIVFDGEHMTIPRYWGSRRMDVVPLTEIMSVEYEGREKKAKVIFRSERRKWKLPLEAFKKPVSIEYLQELVFRREENRRAS